MKADHPLPLIQNERDRAAVFANLLALVDDAHHHMNQCVTNPQKMRFAEQIEMARRLALHYCAEEIIT
jgi:hypothetical protein